MKTAVALLFFALSVISCQASPAAECQWGPSFWCQSKETAMKCGQEAYCNKHVWKVGAKAETQVGLDDCDVCKMIVELVNGLVVNNKTESEAEQALDELCSKLGPLSSECNSLVNTYFPRIWQLLQNQVDPDKVCSEIGLCGSALLKTKPKVEVKVGSVQCDVCKLAVQFVDKYVDNNKTESEAQAALEDLCSKLGSLKDECDTLVTTFFPQIWNLLVNQTDPDKVCTEIKLCTSTSLKLASMPRLNTDGCTICKTVVSALQELLLSNTTEDLAKDEVEKVCIFLGPLKDQCKATIEEYFPQMWQLLQKELSPDQVCSELKLCTSIEKAVPRVKTTECDYCKIIALYLHKFIANNGTESEANSEVKKLCNLMGTVSSECNAFVDMFFDSIWKMLVNETDPDVICQLLKLCDSSALKTSAAPDGNITCDICQLVFVFLRPFIDSNKTEDIIHGLIKLSFCDALFLPDDQNKCKNFFDTYFKYIWGKIEDEVDAGLACKDIGVCKSKASSLPPKRKVTLPKQSLCDMCNLVVGFMKTYVDSNSTEAEVKNALEGFCGILPSSSKTQCTNLVEQNFDIIWKLLRNEIDNGDICKQLGLCNGTMTLLKWKAPLPKQTACDVCKLAVNFLKTYVDSNTTEAEVKQALENVCKILPSGFQSECNNLVVNNFGTIWLLIKSEFDNDLICQQIGLCNSTLSLVKLKVQPPTKSAMPKQTACDICKLIVTFVKPYVDSNSTEKEVEDALDGICKLLPASYASQCNTLLDTFFPTIWDMVKNEFDDSEICSQLKLCNSTSERAKLLLPFGGDTDANVGDPDPAICFICLIGDTFLIPYVKNATVEKIVIGDLQKLCILLPSNITSQCINFISSYIPKIWNSMKTEIITGQLCADIGACPMPSSPLHLLQELTIKSLAVSKPRPVSVAGPACDVCKLLASFLVPFADNRTAENETVAAVQKLCEALPTDYRDTCKQMSQQYITGAWDDIRKELDGGKFCTDIEVCSAKQRKDPEVMVSAMVEGRVPVGDNTLCIVCKTVSSFVREFVENNATKAEAEKAVNELCSKIPAPYNTSCMSLVDTYFDMIWNLIDSYVDDDDLCKQLNICNSTATLQLKTESSGPLCVICEFVMKELESMLDSNTTEAEIKAALDKVCSILPKTISDDCNNFVNTYGDEIIKLLLQAVTPTTVCAALQLCSLEQQKVVVMPVVESVDLKDDCSLCKMVLGFVKTLVEDYQKPIEGALDDVCNLMPTTIKSECTAFVKDFAPAIIQLVDKEIDPAQLCKDIKACTESALMAPWKKLARAKSF